MTTSSLPDPSILVTTSFLPDLSIPPTLCRIQKINFALGQ
ncbi:hypothetical protein GYH30_000781 [Glycine max]|nr:hypothetical protein GYH30_000781 [Glycine max]